MKQQVWLSPVDIDLLVTALEAWSTRMDDGIGSVNRGQWRAVKFTQRRIDEMVARLKPDEDAAP